MTPKPTKKCMRCGIILNQTSFHKSNKQPDGLQNYCRSCMKDYHFNYRKSRKEEGPKVFVEHKTCKLCKQEKPRSQFGRRSVSIDGLNYYCKPCWRGYIRQVKNKNNA